MNDCVDPERRGVYSDVGALKSVLLHPPSEAELIFDPKKSSDILLDGTVDPIRVGEEYSEFIRIIELFGTQVYLVQDMMLDVLSRDSNLRGKITEELVQDKHLSLSTKDLGYILDVNKVSDVEFLGFLLSGFYPASRHGYTMDTIVNTMFTRDIMAVAHDLLIWTWNRPKRARQRESYIVRSLVHGHPVFSNLRDIGTEVMDDLACMIEGGDVMPVTDELILVGYSGEKGRTSQAGINHLAGKVVDSGAKLLVVEFTSHRSKNTIHLDTLITMISDKHCIAYEPMFGQSHGSTIGLGYYMIDSEADIHEWPKYDLPLFEILKIYGLDVQPIYCLGGEKYSGYIPMMEQWQLSANTLALAPGIAIGYDRNTYTSRALEQHGYTVVPSTEIACKADFQAPMFITIPGSELIRMRGGPHCLSMPIERAVI